MTDTFNYTLPIGWPGRLVDVLFLKRYVERLLATRNELINAIAESGVEARFMK